MDQIAFFWVGENVRIPSILVESINTVYESDVKIYQLTDMSTPSVIGVSKVFRQNLSKDVMIARLQAYKNFPFNNDLTCFCDTDSIFVSELNLDELNANIYLVKRSVKQDGKMNANFKEHYPEFENKNVSDVMPYFFGNLIIKDNLIFFGELLEICLKLPDRFHRWFGDQYSLKQKIDNSNLSFELLDNDKYLYLADEILSEDKISNLISSNTKLVTFKGLRSKQFLKQSYLNLMHLKKNKNNIIDSNNSIIGSISEAEMLYKEIIENLR